MNGLKQKYQSKMEFRIFDLSAGQGEREASDMGVIYLPTFVLLKTDGTILDIQVGVVEENYLEEKILELIRGG